MAHLSPQLQNRFLARLLSPEETLDVVKHLRECDACREQLLALRSDKPGSLIDAILPQVSDEEHPSADSLGACLDGELARSDRADLDEHVRTCDLCQKALADLRAFREELLQSPAHEYVPGKNISNSSRGVSGSRFSRLWGQFVAWFSRPLALAGMAAVAAVILVLGIVLVRSPQQLRVAGAESGSQVRVVDGDHWTALGPSGITNPPSGFPRDVLTALNGVAASVLKDEQLSLSPTIKDNLTALKRPPSVLLGQPSGTGPFQVLSPVATLVESVRPTFKWSAAPGAAGYVLHVIADDRTQEEVLTSPVILPTPDATVCQWVPESTSLSPGERYRWYVTATLKDQEVDAPGIEEPQAKFAILSTENAARLNALRESSQGDRLIRGLLYLNAGLLDAAKSDFEYLLAEAGQTESSRDYLTRMLAEIKRLKEM